MMSRQVIHWVAAASMVALVTPPAKAAGDEPFAYRVCKILQEPFVGSITFGSGDGCSWGLSRSDGVTIQEEVAQGVASRYPKPSDVQPAIDTMLTLFKAAAATGVGKLEPLNVCDGGWQISSSIPGHTPSHTGFYRCGSAFVMVTTEGTRSVSVFMQVAEGIVPLLPSLK